MIEQFSAAFDMGEYGVYVWSAWGVALVVLLGMGAAPSLRWRAFLRREEKFSCPGERLGEEEKA